jgi:hypothetical protein
MRVFVECLEVLVKRVLLLAFLQVLFGFFEALVDVGHGPVADYRLGLCAYSMPSLRRHNRGKSLISLRIKA